jgi:hypothetical protein
LSSGFEEYLNAEMVSHCRREHPQIVVTAGDTFIPTKATAPP